jgi:MFS family permease
MDNTSVANRAKLRTGISIFFFISGFGYSSWASRIPSLQQQLHLNEAELGAVLFALPIGLMLTMPITSKMLRHFSSRSIMFGGVTAFTLLLCLPGFTAYMWELILVLFFIGSTRNVIAITVNAQAVGVQAMYDKPIMVTFHGIWSLAGFAGAAVGYVMVYFNILPTYHLIGVSVVLFILTLWFYPSTLEQAPYGQSSTTVFSFPDKDLLKFALIAFACMACENTMYDWCSIYLQKALHASKATSTAAFVVYMFFMTLGRFTGDKIVAATSIKKVLNFSGIFILLGFLMAVLLPYIYTAFIGYAMVGLGISCVVPLVFSMAGKSKTLKSGQALAAISTVSYLGFLIIPPFVGFVAQAAGLRWAFGIVSGFGALIIMMVARIKEETEPGEVLA